jgi:SPP1 gp7 family putative phage head morphogenesis protein
MAKVDQIQGVLDSLTDSLTRGLSFQSWKAEAEKAPEMLALPKGRAEVIFRNAMQQAYNAERWEQQLRNKDARPYLLFSAVNDRRTTVICRSLNADVRTLFISQ